MTKIKKVAIIGTGVIGGGWIIRCLAHNKIVYAFDRDIKLKKNLIAEIKRTWPNVKKLFNKKNIFHANLKAGDAIFFTTYLFHGSTPHVAKKIRWTLISSFHRMDKTPYLKNEKNILRIPYNADYNKL